MVAGLGIEPRNSPPKGGVIPLHHPATITVPDRLRKSVARVSAAEAPVASGAAAISAAAVVSAAPVAAALAAVVAMSPSVVAAAEAPAVPAALEWLVSHRHPWVS